MSTYTKSNRDLQCADNDYELWTDRVCLEELYKFSSELSMEEIFCCRDKWAPKAEKIFKDFQSLNATENFKRYGKYKASLYDIQQCGRDNIEVLLRDMNPELALKVDFHC